MNREIKFRFWDKALQKMIFRTLLPYDNEHPDIVIMQFTGLKDKNGKEIYEGDVLKINLYDDLEWNTKVRFENGGFCIDIERKDYNVTLIGFLDDESVVKIIGNIYENPELL